MLATRGSTWNEMFARVGMYLTVLSAATVALALVAQADDFGSTFRPFALLVLPVVLVLGYGTQARLNDARSEDVWLVVGMNRLRHAYLELAPDLEPYFVTGRFDDLSGILRTYSPQFAPAEMRITPGRLLAGTPVLVAVINAVVAGVLAALVGAVLAAPTGVTVAIGVLVGLTYLGIMTMTTFREVGRAQREWRPRFPGGGDTTTPL
jgi:hypothetical protein